MLDVLLIDDDEKLAPLLVEYCARYDIRIASELLPSAGFSRLKNDTFDAVILDVMLPEMDGFDVCKTIRKSSQIPIIMLTARGEEEDKVRGLNLGASDFVTKPYSTKELLARVRSSLRDHSNKNIDILTYGSLRMDVVAHLVTVSDAKVSLGPIEFKLLRILLENPKKVFSRDQLLARVWHNNLRNKTWKVNF